MKKLILLLSLTFGVLFNSFCQKPSGYNEPNIMYKIDTTSWSNGMQMDSPSYFVINSAPIEIDTAIGAFMLLYSTNFMDSLRKNRIYNDSLKSPLIITISQADYDNLSNPEIYDKYVRDNRLKVIYGTSNVFNHTP